MTDPTVYILERWNADNDNTILGVYTSLDAAKAQVPGVTWGEWSAEWPWWGNNEPGMPSYSIFRRVLDAPADDSWVAPGTLIEA